MNLNKLISLEKKNIRKWYYKAYVNESGGNAVSNANITAYNITLKALLDTGGATLSLPPGDGKTEVAFSSSPIQDPT